MDGWTEAGAFKEDAVNSDCCDSEEVRVGFSVTLAAGISPLVHAAMRHPDQRQFAGTENINHESGMTQ